MFGLAAYIVPQVLTLVVRWPGFHGTGSARWQAPRVAKARSVSVARVLALVEDVGEGRQLGLLGEPRVNLLTLNMALDRQFGAPVSPGK